MLCDIPILSMLSDNTAYKDNPNISEKRKETQSQHEQLLLLKIYIILMYIMIHKLCFYIETHVNINASGVEYYNICINVKSIFSCYFSFCLL